MNLACGPLQMVRIADNWVEK